MMQLKFGCDPELFIQAGAKFLSAHDKIPGTKDHPFRVPGGAIQVDGVAAEFNIDPVETLEEWLDNIFMVKDFMMKEYYLDLVATPTATFDQEYFDSLPEEAKLLGCEPDFNAYTGVENTPPETTEPFRTGAGHIHIGFDEFMDPMDVKHFAVCRELTIQLDNILYPMSLLWDRDTKRRTLYGKVGAFRPKTYGVEYRPISNKWVGDTYLQQAVFLVAEKATQAFFEGILYKEASFVMNLSERLLCGVEPTVEELHEYLNKFEDFYKVPAYSI
jgi:hypothetical protein